MTITQTTAANRNTHDAGLSNDEPALKAPPSSAQPGVKKATKKGVEAEARATKAGPKQASEKPRDIIEAHKAAGRRDAQEEELAPPPPPKANPETVTTGYAAATDPLADLKNDPQYKNLQAYAQTLELMLAGHFDYIDNNFAGLFGIGANDGKISMDDILRAAHDGVDAAQMFNRHPELFQMIGGGADNISREQMGAFLTQVQAEIHAMEQAAKAGTSSSSAGAGVSPRPPPATEAPPPPTNGSASHGAKAVPKDEDPAGAKGTKDTKGTKETEGTKGAAITTPPKDSNATSGSKEAPKYTAAEIDAMLKPPAPYKPTSKTAEGKTDETYQYLDKWTESLESKLDDAIAAGDDTLAQKIQRKIAKLELSKQMILNLQKQQMEAASTMAKLYSDLAMTAIRNIR